MTVFESMILMLTFIVIMKFNSIVRKKEITTLERCDKQLG